MPVSSDSFIIPIGPLSITFLSTMTCLFNNSSSCWTLPVSINTCSELYLGVYLTWHEFNVCALYHQETVGLILQLLQPLFNNVEHFRIIVLELDNSFKRPNYNGNTKKPHIIEAYIWISILTLLISRRIYNIVRKHSPKEKMVRYTQLRWSTIFTENADAQLTLILRYCGVERTFETVMNVYQSQALDPHVNRHRFREEWWS